MRVLLLNYEYPPAGGGAGFATLNIGRELVKLGVEVDILTSRINGEVDGEVIDGVRVFRVTSWRKGMHDCGLIGAYSYVAFAAKKRWEIHKAKDYDLEHFFFSLPTGALTIAPLPRKRPPYIVSLRGSDVPDYDPFNKGLAVMHKLTLPLTKRIWRQASSVIALSEGLREIAAKTDPDLDVGVIPNGIDTEKFKRDDDSPVSSPTAPLKILTVTRLLERKGVHFLLEAIARPTPLNVSLQIVGSGSYEEQLRQDVAELGLTDQVTFAGFVHTDELPDIYRDSDVFVLPSQTESFGLVFAEAMSSSLPVIATTVGGIPELITSGKDGILVAPGRPDLIRGALEKLLLSKSKRRSLGDTGRQRILDKFTWSIVANQYLDLYEASI